tara:strand:+ start:1429 stop:1818 length:390 start_codon:yes stop_codon:yes gene_type:complete
MSLIDELCTVKNAMYLQIITGIGFLVMFVVTSQEHLAGGETAPLPGIILFFVFGVYKLEVARRKLTKGQMVRYAVPILTVIGVVKMIEFGVATGLVVDTFFYAYSITFVLELLAVALLWHPSTRAELKG